MQRQRDSKLLFLVFFCFIVWFEAGGTGTKTHAVKVSLSPGSNLNDALSNAKDGDAFVLGKGVFVLTTVVNLNANVSIEGVGMDETVLECNNYTTQAFNIKGRSLALKGLTVTHCNNTRGGAVYLQGCF